MLLRTLPQPVRDVLVLAARLLVSIVMLAHVWDSFLVKGFVDTASAFSSFGIPLAIAATAFTLVVELVSSVLLFAGIFVTWASAFLGFVMAGAIYFVHAPHGIFIKNGGWELCGLIIAVLLGIVANGPGRLSLDHVLFERRSAETLPAPIDVSSDPAGVPVAPAGTWNHGEQASVGSALWSGGGVPSARAARRESMDAWTSRAAVQRGEEQTPARGFTPRGARPVWDEPIGTEDTGGLPQRRPAEPRTETFAAAVRVTPSAPANEG